MIARVLLFFTGPIQFFPLGAIDVVLISTALSLLDFSSLRLLWRMDWRECGLSLVKTAGVVALGSIKGIRITVTLAIGRFVKHTARPSVWNCLATRKVFLACIPSTATHQPRDRLG